jgi:hypothetical protein
MGERIATKSGAAYARVMRHCLMGIALIGAGALASSGCISAKGCTEIGCIDGFSAAVRSADGSFPSGAHLVEVLVGASSLKCAFTYPLPNIGGGSVQQPLCEAGLTVMILPETTCSASMMASYPCDPIAGKFVETIGLSGTPGQVHAWQYVDDAPILDVAAAPTYQSYAPNGSECGPVCREASASWTFN